MEYRIGQGYDLHKLEYERKLIIGGVEIPHEKGLLGHSDADVLSHAITDALLGALALGDIGTHFPDNDTQYKNIDSLILLKKIHDLILEKGYMINNIDCTIQAQEPKMKPYIPQIQDKLSKLLNIKENQISIKAKTMEGLGPIGEKHAIAAHCSLLLKNIKND